MATVTGLSGAVANPSDHASATVEERAQAEFAQAGAAMRERLEREAAGDASGARLAADDAELHRSQYRRLMRELGSARPTASTSSSVAAPRNPFVPDATSWRAAEAGPIRIIATVGRTQDAPGAVAHAAWDLYSRHGEPERLESPGSPQRADADVRATEEGPVVRGDLYSTGRIAGAWGAAPKDSSANDSSRERSNEPFLVDRERPPPTRLTGEKRDEI